MNPPPRPSQERRRHLRLSPSNTRVRCASGEMEEASKDVDFARKLLNISLGGMCVETTGRLRAGVKLTAEVRFDEFGGALRTQAKVAWAETRRDGALETHVAGLVFLAPELTAPVREFLSGGRATMIVVKRQAEYADLKEKAESRKATVVVEPWSATAKVAVMLVVLLFLYLSSFGAVVFAGRRASPSGGIHFRYAGADSQGGTVEEVLSKLYLPLYWASKRVGLDLTYDPP